MEFKMEGFDEVMKNLQDLADHPEQMLVGQSCEVELDVVCKNCGEEFAVPVQTKILKVVGTKAFGPGYSTKEPCPSCGELNKYQWDEVVAEIRITS